MAPAPWQTLVVLLLTGSIPFPSLRPTNTPRVKTFTTSSFPISSPNLAMKSRASSQRGVASSSLMASPFDVHNCNYVIILLVWETQKLEKFDYGAKLKNL